MYRASGAFTTEQALAIFRQDAPDKLDGRCVEALAEFVGAPAAATTTPRAAIAA